MTRHSAGDVFDLSDQARMMLYVYWGVLAADSAISYAFQWSLFRDWLALDSSALTVVYALWFVTFLLEAFQLLGRFR